MVDYMAMEQVLDNLLDNACKFTGKGGEVVLRAWLEPSDSKVHVSVSDTGVGLTKDFQDPIFERFYQVDGKATRR